MKWLKPGPPGSEPGWRLPFRVAEGAESPPLGLSAGDTVYLRRKAAWRGARLPEVGERMNLLALHTDSKVDPGLIRFNLTVEAVEWGVVFYSEPVHLPLFTLAEVEGDEVSLQWLLDAGWEPEALGNE